MSAQLQPSAVRVGFFACIQRVTAKEGVLSDGGMCWLEAQADALCPPQLLEEAARSASSWSTIKQAASNGSARSVHFHLSTLQDFDPSAYTSSTEAHEAVHGTGTPFTAEERGEKFDVIWAQWCLQHLSDADLATFFERAKASLVPASNDGADAASAKNAVLNGAGCIFVKDNVAQDDSVEEYVWYDEEDKSITRSTLAYERVFREAGLEIVRCEVQLGLPEELFAVKMWALQPKQCFYSSLYSSSHLIPAL